jgi:hypothetical protein
MVVENGPTDPIPQVKEEGKVILVADYLSLGSLKMVVSLRTKTHPLGSSQEEATKTSPVRPNALGVLRSVDRSVRLGRLGFVLNV